MTRKFQRGKNAALAALLVTIAVTSDCSAAVVNFITDNGDFNAGSSWSDGNVPTADFDQHYIQDNLTSNFTVGNTSVFLLAVGDTSKGTLNVSGGNLKVTGENRFEVGRSVGGEGTVNITGAGILTVDGAVIGTRSKGVVNIGPGTLFDLKDAEPSDRDIRIGSFGPGFNPVGEPLLNGDGLVVVQGTLDGSTAIISQSGAKGELRLQGGTINLANRLWMDLCDNCATTTSRSAKVSIIGSTGSFNVGGGDIFATSPTAIFSYTADAGGVVPIISASGAEIDTAKLELNLDAYVFTPTSTLTLIDAIPGLLNGTFGTVTFSGNTTATVNYDLLTGDVFLDNFQRTVLNVPGDYNGNQVVDAADYTIFRDTLGSTTDLRANGDNTGASAGRIDQADYTFWRNRFGNTMSAGIAASAAVPEPRALAIAILGSLFALLMWRPADRRLQVRVAEERRD